MSSYPEFIQKFSSLFEEIKKEDKNLPFLFNEAKDESIYNAMVGFNTVKFLIEYPNWDEDENKNKACEIILQECNKTKETKKKLGLEVKLMLKDKNYIEGGVQDVSIRGNHASITLGDNKKEFKISEFLNSDFCEKNEISGFSTLHSDGKSGMHGFVAEEGGRKIRHYVVTDGSYEMTLNWYDKNGGKCTIKIKIDKDGVDPVELNGVTNEQLETNKDVKIGGLFLHQIQFREKGKANEVKQNNRQSFETFIESDSQNVGVQAHFRPQSNSRRQSYDSGIEKDFDNKINSQEAKEKRERRQAAREENSEDQVYNLQSLFEENPQNKKTPPSPPPRTSSLKKDVFNEQGGLDHQDDGLNELSSDVTDITQKRFTENVLEKIKEEKPIYKWLKDKTGGKESNQNLDALEKKLSPKSGQGNIVEKRENDSNRPTSPVSTEGNIDVGQSNDAQLQKSSRRSGQESTEEERNFQKISEALESWKEKRRNAEQKDPSTSSQMHTNRAQSQVDSEQLKKVDFSSKLLQSDVTSELKVRFDQDNCGLKKVNFINKPPQNKDESELQEKFNQKKCGLKPADQKGMSAQTRERLLKDGLLKDNSTDVKKVAERENANTNPTVDKNSELYKLLEKDEAQLKAGVIEEEREDTLAEHTNSHDRNRIALANRNRKLLWTKHVTESQQEKGKDKGISI
ncbi:hypothetical protein HET73_00075 [Wolbachia endosymbiont of Atemnus politus]|uniref:hypothetical protein n=1 Tax=Wolbachia endosymbiont of Atemnus politus TaxID=2682840 RepID=UPI0015742F00|nr:hypothetical protein [Wolbachia endosymbiont of Atemnus politus]NSM56129.1 hypothetical protein [Wolbachia endosymbiont of Atemnus politus]NSX82950.1 hypothetical protein [Wolbachia endosymbiont of Atemnus politus]